MLCLEEKCNDFDTHFANFDSISTFLRENFLQPVGVDGIQIELLPDEAAQELRCEMVGQTSGRNLFGNEKQIAFN